MLYLSAPLPNCEDSQYVSENYNTTSPETGQSECLLDFRRRYAGRIYFAVAILHAVIVISTTLLFIYCALGPIELSTSKTSANLDMTQIKKARKRHSLRKRSVMATTLGATGHLIFSTCMFLTQAFNEDIGCELLLYGVIIGFYTWVFAFCIRAYRLKFLLRLNQLKVRYLRMRIEERTVCINEKDYCWYITNQQNRKYILTMPYIVYFLSLCIIVIVTVPAEVMSIQKYGYCMMKWGAGVLIGLYAFFIGCVVPFMLWYLRNNADAHGIRTEIWIDAIIGIPFFVLYVVWFAISLNSTVPYYINKVYGPTNWVVFFTIVAHIIAVIVPLIDYVPIENRHWVHMRRKVKRFYRKVTKQPPHDTTSSMQHHLENQYDPEQAVSTTNAVFLPELSMESLEQTLSDPDMMNILQDLAIRDFSSENLLFYEKYLQLEKKFKEELTAVQYEHMDLDNVDLLRSWIRSRTKKSPSMPHIAEGETAITDQRDDDSENNTEEKQNTLGLEQFMSIPIPFKLYPDFIRFYETFIREGSPTQVNISYRARHSIDQLFNDIYEKYPVLNPNAVGESSSHPTGSICHNGKGRREKEKYTEYSKINMSKKSKVILMNDSDHIVEYQESATLLNFNMFETARVEVCWNIFNSVYPKLVDMYNSNSNSVNGSNNGNNSSSMTP